MKELLDRYFKLEQAGKIKPVDVYKTLGYKDHVMFYYVRTGKRSMSKKKQTQFAKLLKLYEEM